ncbi:hypothetical protein BYT27DRAFT_7188714 [Phlegmacium glaucopus]|nr:hypothetical protein BYT27DRAFT_7188714 [Phlegmacium glaucopus]
MSKDFRPVAYNREEFTRRYLLFALMLHMNKIFIILPFLLCAIIAWILPYFCIDHYR